MGVLRQISLLPEAIQRLTAEIRNFKLWQMENAPAEARLEALERSRAVWEAELEALVLKAESTLKSANNAESRARTMKRHNEKHADPFDDDGEEVERAVPEGYAPAVPEEELQPLHMGVATDDKARAMMLKFS